MTEADRSCWDDYAEMIALLPEGNRLILAAIRNGIGRMKQAFVGRPGCELSRQPQDQHLP